MEVWVFSHNNRLKFHKKDESIDSSFLYFPPQRKI